jgi:hypothetical protein
MNSIEADVTELLEKRDETPFFGKLDSDLTEPGGPDPSQSAEPSGETTLEIERTSRSFEGSDHVDLPLEDEEDDDKVMGDD